MTPALQTRRVCALFGGQGMMFKNVFLWMGLVATAALGGFAHADSDCGNLANAYGPFDYTNADHFNNKLGVVERFHFTSKVESLIEGESGALALDIDYTLRAFPNHHRALWSAAKLQLQKGWSPGEHYFSAECYFDRAMNFQPKDGMVRMIYGIYLHKKHAYKDALVRYQEALELLPDSSEVYYNMGLLYVDLKDFANAKIAAEKAYGMGYPLPGLKNQLLRAGHWDKNASGKPAKTP